MATLDMDVIAKEFGDWGRYQVYNYILLSLPVMFTAMHKIQFIFVAPDTNYRCIVPECESPPYNYKPGDWGSFTLPADEEARRCKRLKPQGNTCAAASFTEEPVACHSWVYENEESAVHTYNLACDEMRRTTIGSVNGVGIFFGIICISYISDRFGRKAALIIAIFFTGVFCSIRAFSVNYYMHLVFEFIATLFGAGTYSCGFVLAVEMVTTSQRVVIGSIMSTAYAVGAINLGWLAYLFPYWRTLLLIMGVPCLLFISYYWIINESIRWLVVKGRHEQALKTLKRVAKINKVSLSENTERMILNYQNDMSESPTTRDAKETFVSGMKSKILVMRVFINIFWWMTVNFIYYGLSINSVTLAGNKYVNFIIMNIAEFPGIWITVPAFNRLGRKITLLISFALCGIGLLLIAFVPFGIWFTIIALVGKMFITLAYNGVYVYSVELFPTRIRHRCIGVCSMLGRVGTILAPLTPALMLIWKPLPYTVFGAFSFISCTFTLLTPETLNKKLPDTIEEAEAL